MDSAHGVPAATRKLTYILDEIINWFLLKIALPDVDVANVPLEPGSKHVSMLHIMDEIGKIHKDQLEEYSTGDTDLDVGRLHLGKYAQYIINTTKSSHSNLIEMLVDANPRQIVFLAPDTKPLTYGKLLQFIRGDGDLRRVGARANSTGRSKQVNGPVLFYLFLRVDLNMLCFFVTSCLCRSLWCRERHGLHYRCLAMHSSSIGPWLQRR